MRIPTKEAMREIISELRAIPPKRPMTYGESIYVSHVQAARYRTWIGATKPDINLIGLVKQRLIPVNFVPAYRLAKADGTPKSGLTTDAIGGKLQMFVNENEPEVRQRFSILHELKHALDFEDADILHAKLGRGNTGLQADMIEWICNEFAANVLMPTAMVKRIWFTTQDLTLAANLFNVSTEAMATRLEKLGLTGERKAPRMYFRQVGNIVTDAPCLAA